MTSDLEHPSADLPYSHAQLQGIWQLLDTEIEASRPTVRHGFASLGFNPDYLLYEDSFCRKLATFLPERKDRADFYRFYYRRTWQHQPGAMERKFTVQLGLFYCLDCPVYEQKITRLDRNYKEIHDLLSDPSRSSVVAQVPAVADYVASLPGLIAARWSVVQPKMFKPLMIFLARSYVPGLFLGLAAMAWLLAEADIRAACGRFATVVALGYAYNLGNNLAIALFHTLGIARYSHVQLATTLLTQVLSLWLVIEVVARKFARSRLAAENTSGEA
jgi:hypothetical protein